MPDRRYASTATTDMRRTLVRLTATTGPAGFQVVCLSVRGRGFTDTMDGPAFQATMAAEASPTVAATMAAEASATVAATTDARLSVDAVWHAVQWAASTVASGADFAVQREVASTAEAADAAKGSRRLTQRSVHQDQSQEKSPRLRLWAFGLGGTEPSRSSRCG
jgi:hypothetical protein